MTGESCFDSRQGRGILFSPRLSGCIAAWAWGYPLIKSEVRNAWSCTCTSRHITISNHCSIQHSINCGFDPSIAVESNDSLMVWSKSDGLQPLSSAVIAENLPEPQTPRHGKTHYIVCITTLWLRKLNKRTLSLKTQASRRYTLLL